MALGVRFLHHAADESERVGSRIGLAQADCFDCQPVARASRCSESGFALLLAEVFGD